MNDSKLTFIGKKIQQIRIEQGLSQEQLATRCGCHRNFIGLVERGQKNPSILKLICISEALGVSITDLIPKHP